jgi:uncharacterized membrane protein YecN with MAPEG domain
MTPTHAAALLYIGIFGLFLIVLSVHVSRLRQRHRVSLGTKGSPEMERAQRAQANFVEYVPLFLLALAGLAFANESAYVIHILGILFLVGRVIHAWAMLQADTSVHHKGRVVGMTLTWPILAIASAWVIVDAVTGHAI